MLYDYLKQNYALNEPILVSDLHIDGVPMNRIRQQISRLVESGRLKRFDTGIYYLPAPGPFRSGSAPSIARILERKYLRDGGKACGYLTGVCVASRIGVTAQVPMAYELASNRATTEYRTAKLGLTKIILRKPRAEVNDSNARALQLLDFLNEADVISELSGASLSEKLLSYMRLCGLSFDDLRPYLRLYPDRIFRNMYEAGLLQGISL